MDLSNLKPAPGATRDRKRVGRGPGSGTGKTAAKGHKGQKARSGYSRSYRFEGGQMPLVRRIPKRGFTNIHAKPAEAVNVGQLAGMTGEVNAEVLKERGLIRNPKARLKILGKGDLTVALTVRAHSVSEGARQKIEGAGGTVELIVVPRRLKRFKKKVR